MNENKKINIKKVTEVIKKKLKEQENKIIKRSNQEN